MEDSIGFVFRLTGNGEVAAHPVHRKWARQVSAESLGIAGPDIREPIRSSLLRDVVGSLTDTIPADKDVYVFENPSTLYCLPAFERKAPDAIKIYLETNWRRYPAARDTAGTSFFLRFAKRVNNRLDAWLLNRLLRRYVDGFVTVSQMVAQELNGQFNKPTVVVRPFIEYERAESMQSTSPNYNSNVACFVGDARHHKGVKRIVDHWTRVRDESPDARLFVVGEGHPESYDDVPGVSNLGYIDNLSDVFSKCSVYIHPAYYDACPVAVAEASYAGLPCVVTETTGTKELVSLVDPSLVCANSPDAIIAALQDYFDTSFEFRQAAGKRSHLVAQSLVEGNRRNEFKCGIERLVHQIRSAEQ